jgi:hypothetical protein
MFNFTQLPMMTSKKDVARWRRHTKESLAFWKNQKSSEEANFETCLKTQEAIKHYENNLLKLKYAVIIDLR